MGNKIEDLQKENTLNRIYPLLRETVRGREEEI